MSKKQELNEWLAEEIMGWETKSFRKINSEDWFDGDDFKYYGVDWNPLTNLEQAFDVLEEYCSYPANIDDNPHSWVLRPVGDSFDCHIEYQKGNILATHIDDIKPLAIIGAILKAEGIYEEFGEVFNNDQT